MNKKGFTLIELLAVIVILAIIAVIAIPRILNVVDEAKKGAAEASALGYIDAVEKQIMINATSKKYDEIIDGTYQVPLNPKYGVTVKGKAPESGEIVIEKGKVKTYSVVVDGYTISYDGTSKKTNKGTCAAYAKNEVVLANGYTGDYAEFTAECTGTFKIELWGSSGIPRDNDYCISGKGGYTSGTITLTKDEKLYIYVGGQGVYDNSRTGFNASTVSAYASGATDVRYFSETPSNADLVWSSFNGLKSRIMVAGAGGTCRGDSNYGTKNHGGAGGGLSGYNALNSPSPSSSGGTQTAGGGKGTANGAAANGGFGIAGDAAGLAGYSGSSGYYGSGSATWISGNPGGSGGGSSFISGYTGCNAISSTSTSGSIVHTNQANHFSGKVFTNSVMIDGKGCDWSTGSATNCGENQPQPDGTMAEGRTGDGYAKITYLG